MSDYNKHQILVNEIMCALSKNKNIRVWANNTGVAKSLDDERFLKYGLVGSADITGIIGPHGKRLEIEVKTGNAQQSRTQRNFELMILSRGGIYILARSVLDALKGVANVAHTTSSDG